MNKADFAKKLSKNKNHRSTQTALTALKVNISDRLRYFNMIYNIKEMVY